MSYTHYQSSQKKKSQNRIIRQQKGVSYAQTLVLGGKVLYNPIQGNLTAKYDTLQSDIVDKPLIQRNV